MNENKIQEKKVWKVVLTGGPCGGKTTGETEIFFFNVDCNIFAPTL